MSLLIFASCLSLHSYQMAAGGLDIMSTSKGGNGEGKRPYHLHPFFFPRKHNLSQECLAYVSLAISMPVNGHCKILGGKQKQEFNQTQ